MANILRDDSGSLGIVDWEAAIPMHFPLTDLLYLYVDAIAGTFEFDSRFGAFQACFLAQSTYMEHLDVQIKRLKRATRLPDELADLCVHACWLHHAANEQERDANASSGPFLEIAQWLTLNYQGLGAPSLSD